MSNFHAKSFDAGTLAKLEIFRDYAREWLPVFIHSAPAGSTITLVDFFSGPGKDSQGRAGSPLLLLDVIREFEDRIKARRITVRFVLNEMKATKFGRLKKLIESKDWAADLCKPELYNLEFDGALDSLYPSLKKGPNLLFLDQQGVKAISEITLQRLIALPRTDVIFFIASSFLRRFVSHPHVKKYLNIPRALVYDRDYTDTHRAVAHHYRSLLPRHRRLYLHHYSIKKQGNIHGLIFASSHPLGIEKFLRVCWRHDPTYGEANFDIDGEKIDPDEPSPFPEFNVANKIIKFEQLLEAKIIAAEIATDRDVYEYSIQSGMLPRHGKKVVMRLKTQGRIRMESDADPRVSWKWYNEPRRIEVLRDGAV